MLKTYITNYEFYIDGRKVSTFSSDKYLKEEHELEKDVISGNTFESLWQAMEDEKYKVSVFTKRKERTRWSNKRRIEFFGSTKTWKDNGKLREWALVVTEEEITLTFSEVLHLDSDLVMQYLKENGIKIIKTK